MARFFASDGKHVRRGGEISDIGRDDYNNVVGGKKFYDIGHRKFPTPGELEDDFARAFPQSPRDDHRDAENGFLNPTFPTVLDGRPEKCEDVIRKLANQLHEVYNCRHEKYISDVLVPHRREDVIHVADELVRNANCYPPAGNNDIYI